ncbi:uncharacterized protein PHACADRAFT_251880 [Phanerochaete carnosa HHB-10118-sp]|uniref:Uncharacterized protein n=1 Tax=Phanerochaete carnosa (strain HHB-10118-sp) TaxID=650164 RepID=K5WF90_PHACS|nr:uncharacterized protein PHACADRAFT_251880 [Phanerochaete carnosa HHB-10118-sp]EKM57955.1 hypothetical protein PHACADRAFT_251880 [Phanerochaete carnosa HHB-10118-sp]
MTSSCTDTSARSASPSASDSGFSESSHTSASSSPARRPSNSFRLVRSTVEEANAFILVPAPVPYVESISSLARAKAPSNPKSRQARALLLVGPALEYLRHPRVRIAKGARVHPYRVVPHCSRRTEMSTPSGSRI